MSELYLHLRSRLEVVTDWVYIDRDVLREARERAGGREKVASRLHISSKTLERYEAEGRFPRPMLAAISRELHLEIEIEEDPLRVAGRVDYEPDAEVADRLDRIERVLEELVARLGRAGLQVPPT